MTTLQFYVINRRWRVREKYECVVFNLVESDFEETTDWFFFQIIKKWHSYGCHDWGCQNDRYNERCDFCIRIIYR